ncbi:hypothetical protein [Paracoccus alkanivorans]|uniref:hypothetical protein n=1 Tax=Paracoccus alkanivorans TaxID=2116655 RepID=UPI001FB68935|nr:hypothetical protein [Paracoccus alkanivorans]
MQYLERYAYCQGGDFLERHWRSGTKNGAEKTAGFQSGEIAAVDIVMTGAAG